MASARRLPLASLPLALVLAACAPTPDKPMAQLPPSPTPTDEEKGVRRNLAYGDDPRQTLDLYLPDETPTTLFAFVHGGAWQSGSRHEYDAVASQLRRAGHAVATVDYRLSPGVRHPGHAEDVAHALAWLREHAGERDGAPLRIVAIGHSAGAHILATLATDPRLFALAQPAGLVGLEGIYDVLALAKRWPRYPDWFLKKAFGPEDGWAAASPTRRRLATKVPWLLVHSRDDELVDQGQTDAFAAHLRQGGALGVQVVYVDGESHDGVVRSLAATGNETIQAIVAFEKAPVPALKAQP